MDKPEWTFLTNHAHVLLCLHRQPEMRMRDVAMLVGITERAVQAIVRDLEKVKCLRKEKKGRRNSYEIRTEIALRHPLENRKTVGDLLKAVK
ncbi:MAG TPA: ArsR family transcriptional regulator [Leptospiraceae bacterium]|nr:ArsR family transcriptional regulator [Leptospiraceae bacterium]